MVDPLLLKAILKGLLTYIPGVSPLIINRKFKSNHSCSDAEFCYVLWLKMLVFFKENGMNPNLNEIGEIGNGGSLGVAICAVLSGCEKYYALEIEELFNRDQNLKLLDEIVMLFRNKTRISDNYKQLNIKINNHDYPEDIIKPLFLNENLITEIRNNIFNRLINSKRIQIIKNWEQHPSLKLDLIFSRAVMEHVSAPGSVYKGISFHLKVGSLMFHDIEFHSHGLTEEMDGHYRISEFIWKIILGKRKYLLNRWSYINHHISMIDNGFQIIKTQKTYKLRSVSGEKVLYGAIILSKKVK